MKKLKVFLCVALFGAMGFGAFSAYEHLTMSEEECFLLANVEALSDPEDEIGGGSGVYYEGYYNETMTIYNFRGELHIVVKIPVGVVVEQGASGILTYCEDTMFWWKKCYKDLNQFIKL